MQRSENFNVHIKIKLATIESDLAVLAHDIVVTVVLARFGFALRLILILILNCGPEQSLHATLHGGCEACAPSSATLHVVRVAA